MYIFIVNNTIITQNARYNQVLQWVLVVIPTDQDKDKDFFGVMLRELR